MRRERRESMSGGMREERESDGGKVRGEKGVMEKRG